MPTTAANKQEATVIDINGPTQQSLDALHEIASYYLMQEHATDSKGYTVGKYVLLGVVSGASMWVYATTGSIPAGCDSFKFDNPGCNKSLGIKYLIGGTLVNFEVTWNTSQAFIDYIKSTRHPKELAQFFKPSKSDKANQAIIAIGAFLSAGEVALAGLSKKIKQITPYDGIEIGVTWFANTFVHTLPMMLIMNNPILRNMFFAPLLPFIHSYKLIKHVRSTPEEIREKIQKEQIARDHAELKQALIGTLQAARKQILNVAFKPQWKKLAYQIDRSKLEFTADNPITHMLNLADKAPALAENSKSSNTFFSMLCSKDFWSDTLGKLSYTLGAGFVEIGVSGYFKNTFDETKEITDNESLQWGIASPANIFLGVMVGYFAGRFFKNILFDSLVSTIRGDFQAPLGFKLYPKTVLTLIALSAWLSYYSIGTGLYLIEKGFADKEFDAIRQILIFCATYGNPIFNFKNAIEFILDKAVQFAEGFGNDDNKAAAALDGEISKLINAIQNMDGPTLEECLDKKRSFDERKKLLRIGQSDFQKLTKHEVTEATPRNFREKVVSYFWKTPAVGERRPLLGLSNSGVYSQLDSIESAAPQPTN